MAMSLPTVHAIREGDFYDGTRQAHTDGLRIDTHDEDGDVMIPIWSVIRELETLGYVVRKRK